MGAGLLLKFLLSKLPDSLQLRVIMRDGSTMFGKPEWFRVKTVGWGLSPIRWQGWAYTAAWAAVIAIPFLALLTQIRLLESVVWVAFGIGMLVWDVRKIRQSLTPKLKDDVFVIDEDTEPISLNTRRFDMHLRA